jgi:hypothetical protein
MSETEWLDQDPESKPALLQIDLMLRILLQIPERTNADAGVPYVTTIKKLCT